MRGEIHWDCAIDMGDQDDDGENSMDEAEAEDAKENEEDTKEEEKGDDFFDEPGK